MTDYTYKNIVDAYRSVGVTRGGTILLRTDLRPLGRFESKEKEKVLEAHFKALSELVGLDEGTIIVPAGTPSLCNTDNPFDIQNTPSEMGILTEYIRMRKGAVRSFHPFVSYAAIGKHADYICGHSSRHAYGPETPEARAIELDALDISIGLHPRFTASVIHHIEQVMGVPYRYTKEFEHPVMRDGRIKKELFYMFVWYRICKIKKNKNIRIFGRFAENGYKVNEVLIGRGKVYSYFMREFYNSTIKLMSEDIYAWLDEIPDVRPYRE